MKNKFPRRSLQVIGAIVGLFVCLWLIEVVTAFFDFGPTAIVVDAETGKPVEGAIALAQWYRAANSAPFEGGSEALSKTKETYSDNDGKVFIKGFWGVSIFLKSPRLAVYKPGYVLWDSRWLCPTLENRNDFDKNNRTVNLLKFEHEAARWLKEYPERFTSVGPRTEHYLFYSLCDLNSKKFSEIFEDYELPLINKARREAIHKKSIEGKR